MPIFTLDAADWHRSLAYTHTHDKYQLNADINANILRKLHQKPTNACTKQHNSNAMQATVYKAVIFRSLNKVNTSYGFFSSTDVWNFKLKNDGRLLLAAANNVMKRSTFPNTYKYFDSQIKGIADALY
uniref:Uncharacterized protein n=1 Tax=Glossina pallidipes TaxID=7398 RepID=A0A1B0A960_GLOPL